MILTGYFNIIFESYQDRALINFRLTATKDKKKMEAVLQLKALKGCVGKNVTCEEFKASLKKYEKESKGENSVTLTKCKFL